MKSTFLTFGAVSSAARVSSICCLPESVFRKTSTTTRLRTSLAVPVVAWTIGMKTPSTRAVSRIVSRAASDGAALRESARSASLRKKLNRISVRVALDADAQLAAQAHRELAGRLVRAIEAGLLVADDAALAQLDHAAAHLVDHLLVVGGHDDGRTGAVDPVDQLHDPDRGLGVEVAGRLVAEQERRVVDEGASDADSLLLAAGELVGVVVELGAQADQAQDVRHLAADHLPVLPDHLERVGDVRVDGAVGEQLVVLEDDAEVAAQPRDLAARHVGQRVAGDQDVALGRLELLHQKADAGRLAAARGPDEEHELAAADLHAHALQADVPPGIDLGEVIELDYGNVGRAALDLRFRRRADCQRCHVPM